MKREDIKLLLELAIGIFLIIITVKFFIKLLPLIIIVLVGLLIYDSYQRRGKNTVPRKKEKSVKEAEIVKEKNND